jgi:hypothetical protein
MGQYKLRLKGPIGPGAKAVNNYSISMKRQLKLAFATAIVLICPASVFSATRLTVAPPPNPGLPAQIGVVPVGSIVGGELGTFFNSHALSMDPITRIEFIQSPVIFSGYAAIPTVVGQGQPYTAHTRFISHGLRESQVVVAENLEKIGDIAQAPASSAHELGDILQSVITGNSLSRDLPVADPFMGEAARNQTLLPQAIPGMIDFIKNEVKPARSLRYSGWHREVIDNAIHKSQGDSGVVAKDLYGRIWKFRVLLAQSVSQIQDDDLKIQWMQLLINDSDIRVREAAAAVYATLKDEAKRESMAHEFATSSDQALRRGVTHGLLRLPHDLRWSLVQQLSLDATINHDRLLDPAVQSLEKAQLAVEIVPRRYVPVREWYVNRVHGVEINRLLSQYSAKKHWDMVDDIAINLLNLSRQPNHAGWDIYTENLRKLEAGDRLLRRDVLARLRQLRALKASKK